MSDAQTEGRTQGPPQLHYERFGDPSDPALLLVNGLGSQMVTYRVELCELFVARGYQVIRFDNRDVGLSDGFDDHTPNIAAATAALTSGEPIDSAYTLSDLAADAMVVLDALGIERAHIAGVSMGAMIVQTIAIEHPERVLSLISIMSTTGEAGVGSPTGPARDSLFAAPPTDRASAVAAYIESARVIGSPEFFDEARLAEMGGELYDRAFRPAGVARQLEAIWASGDRVEALQQLDVPTLVLHGTVDPLITPDGGERTAELIGGAKLVLVEGMGHDYPPGLWPRLVDEIAGFADSVEGR